MKKYEFDVEFDIPVTCILDPEEATDADTRAQVLAGDACWTADGAYINSVNADNGLDINGMPARSWSGKREACEHVAWWRKRYTSMHARSLPRRCNIHARACLHPCKSVRARLQRLCPCFTRA